MNYLIDTHILLWYMLGDPRVDSETQAKIEAKANTIYLSNASLWEIAIKVSIGKLKLKTTLLELKDHLIDQGIQRLDFDYDDLETLLTLPFHHQDPFDRLIIAQSKTRALGIITNDEQVKRYF